VSILFLFIWATSDLGLAYYARGSNIALHFALAHSDDLDLALCSPTTDGLEVVTLRGLFNAWLADAVILRFAGGFLCFGRWKLSQLIRAQAGRQRRVRGLVCLG